MAEAAVFFTINQLVFLLTNDRVRREVNLWRGLRREQIEYIRMELESMRWFLRESEKMVERGEAESPIEPWVDQVRELAFRIQDIVDDHRSNVASGGFLRNLLPRREVASKFEKIKEEVRELKERSDRYSHGGGGSAERGDLPFGGASETTRHDREVLPHFVPEDALVGIENPKNDLLRMLVDGDGASATSTVVVSVVGMGGLGKTTICKNVYKDQRVVDFFDCKAWVDVSKSYSLEEILRKIIKEFVSSKWDPAFEEVDKMGQKTSMENMVNYLSTKRYLVVFDDVWDTEFWESVKVAFPDNGRGNRIVITTRNVNVAPSSSASPFHLLYRLQDLPPEKAFELYCKKAFPLHGGECPQDLRKYSEAIVERCGGLPLALVVIGGLSARKEKTVPVWKKLADDLKTGPPRDPQLPDDLQLLHIQNVLRLSYLDLPHYLKSCFLYLGLFPEDYTIRCSRIIRLWMAEGFIGGRQGMAPEEVAEEYVNELVCRNMVQVASFKPDGKVRACRLHDMVRDLIINKSKYLDLLHVSLSSCEILKGRGRHVAVHGSPEDSYSRSSGNSKSRTILFFGIKELPHSNSLAFLQHTKLLKSLDLERAPVHVVPKEIGNLWHLRYLSLKHTKVDVLPSSIGKLANLQTLDVRDTPVIDLPNEIIKLHQLRHLLAYFYQYDHLPDPNTMRGMRCRGSIACLKVLQRLGYIEVDCPGFMEDLEKLVELRRLLILKLRREDGHALCNALEKLVNLQRLSISSIEENEFPDLDSLSSPPPLLERLSFVGPLAKLPHWLIKLKSLLRLHFVWSRLGDDAMEVIRHLNNLQELRIYDGYNGKKLHFGEGSFEKLKVLHLRNLAELDELTIEEGALPVLQFLRLGPSPLLANMPLQFLKSLKTLQLYDIHKELALGMLPDGAHHHWEIEHVQAVTFFYRNKGRKFDAYKQGDPELKRRLLT